MAGLSLRALWPRRSHLLLHAQSTRSPRLPPFVFCSKFLNRCEPGAVDEAAVAKVTSGGAKVNKGQVNPWQNTEQLNAFLEAAKAAGLEFGNVGSNDFAKADEAHKVRSDAVLFAFPAERRAQSATDTTVRHVHPSLFTLHPSLCRSI
jgi:hypothetical protein